MMPRFTAWAYGAGDVRPEDNVWIGPVIEASFELSALENPYMAVLKFHDCDAIRMEDFNHQSARGNPE